MYKEKKFIVKQIDREELLKGKAASEPEVTVILAKTTRGAIGQADKIRIKPGKFIMLEDEHGNEIGRRTSMSASFVPSK